jgi:hypothetical protein
LIGIKRNGEKKMKKFLSFLLVGTVLLALASCKPAGPKLEKIYKGDGTYDPATVQPVKITDLINTPDKYAGTFVSITGKIVTECSVGCWFYMQDEAGNQVHIDLAGQNFNIPQTVGKSVKVTGVFQSSESNTKVSAYEVEYLP